jgi:methionyl-tRNA formyltransferase
MQIVVCCATQRGYRFLQRLFALAPEHTIFVFSFREDPWEPPFLEDIRQLTLSHGQQFFEAKQIAGAQWAAFWDSTSIDMLFAVSWRYLIPPALYSRFRRGAFIFHDSLLPHYRGFAPTVWAIINGATRSGVTLFQIAERVDAGDIVDQQAFPIGPDETIAEVMEQATQTYLLLLERNITTLLEGEIVTTPQDEAAATYTCRRLPEDNLIDWSQATTQVYNLIRAVSYPYPGAFTYWQDQKLTIWQAQTIPDAHSYVGRVPGRVVEVQPGKGVTVLTGDGSLRLVLVQLEGHDPIQADKILTKLSYTLGGT